MVATLALLALGVAAVGLQVMENNALRASIDSVRASVTSAETGADAMTSMMTSQLAALTSEVEGSIMAIENICKGLEDAGNVAMAELSDPAVEDEATTAINSLIEALNGIANCPTP